MKINSNLLLRAQCLFLVLASLQVAVALLYSTNKGHMSHAGVSTRASFASNFSAMFFRLIDVIE